MSTENEIIQGQSLWRDAWRQLRGKRMAMVSLWLIGLYFGLALYGEGTYWYYQWRDTTPFYQQANLEEEYLPPSIFRAPFAIQVGNIQIIGRAGQPCPAVFSAAQGCAALPREIPVHPVGFRERLAQGVRNLCSHPFGTDNLGRDVFQRTVQGARIAFQVGIITSCIAIPIGVILGCLAGYFGGRTDDFIVWLYSTFASIPGLLFILAVAMVAGKGLLGVYLGIGLTTWVGLCRLIRGEVMKHKARSYVLAARVLGFSHFRIMFRHILPNIFHIVIISFSLRFPAAISTEVFITVSFTGRPPWIRWPIHPICCLQSRPGPRTLISVS